MKNKILKNFIAFVAFIVFALFLMQKYLVRYSNSIVFQKMAELAKNYNIDIKDYLKKYIRNDVYDKTEESVESTEIIETITIEDTVPFEDFDRLDPYYTRENINYERIAGANENIYKEKLIALLNRFAVSDLREIAGEERLNYIKLYDGMKIVGDSNVRHLDYYQVLEKEYYYPLPGKNIKYQTEHAKEYVDTNTKKIVFWNGYNIAKYDDSKEYVKDYQALVDKVKEINPDTEVYICSLMPATDMAIENDFKGDIVHNIYRGKEFDKALKEHFGDKYIDIKFMGKEKYYGNDGIHFMPQFYYMLIPYLAYYLSLSYE